MTALLISSLADESTPESPADSVGDVRSDGKIPKGWELMQLATVAQLESGHTPSRNNPEYWGGDIPWLSLHDTDVLDQSEVFNTSQSVTQKGIDNSSARVLPKGTVVFSRTATVGKATVLGREMATSQDFACYICGPRVFNHFLVYLFRYMEPEWRRYMAGSTHNTVYMPVFRTLRVPLPPRPEQEAIAEALRDADALIESLEQLIKKKRQIKQGAMQGLLSGRRRLPGFSRKWVQKRLGDGGNFFKGSGIRRDQAQSGDLPCIRYGELYTHHNNLIRRFNSQISRDVAATAQKVLRGDILFAGSGETKEEIGKCAVLVAADEAYAGGDVIVFRPSEDDPIFLGYYLNSASVQSQKAAKGQGDAVVHISSRALADVELVVPERDEQTAIAHVFVEMDAELDALEFRLQKARQIKHGMMQELLTGRVRLV